jgi:hypothetical protein
MLFHKPNPVESFEALRERLSRFFMKPLLDSLSIDQLILDLPAPANLYDGIEAPVKNATEFLNFISDALPTGDLYLFGGILRDMALFGKKGFNSDIDLVVEGDWDNCISYLEYLGAKINKFGGYRLIVSGQPIDIWNARETWAIKNGLINYEGIASLTETTVLNWDAILMNWRTKNFICRNNYLEQLRERVLDVVLEHNPNPKGMAIRVFRHLCLKDAKKITPKAAKYLEQCTNRYTFNELTDGEYSSFGNTVIEYAIYRLFKELNQHNNLSIRERLETASELVEKDGLTLSSLQLECDFNNQINC